ncbi:MAG: hypothetical protein QNJ63_03605 [Calothrix sp. MO_192.B10]|nr:hypothetical protein [Calothrix sp. MO_192.B10]
MNNSSKLVVWGIVSFIFFILYWQRRKDLPNLSTTINLALASGGLVVSISLFWSLIYSQELINILEKEIGFDIIALYIGVFAAGWVSLQPIVQLLQPSSLEGRIEEYNILENKIFNYNFHCSNKQVYKIVIIEDTINKLISSNTHRNLISNPKDLIGKKISITDVVPINNGSKKELRINSIQQISIKN